MFSTPPNPAFGLYISPYSDLDCKQFGAGASIAQPPDEF